MKYSRLVALLCGAILLTAATVVHAQAERILQFDSRVEVQTNGSLIVIETIQVQAQNHQIKHGIYRDFPQLYRGKWGFRQKAGFVVREVQRDGKEEPLGTAETGRTLRSQFRKPLRSSRLCGANPASAPLLHPHQTRPHFYTAETGRTQR